MILFIVVMISCAKTLHDINLADEDQTKAELIVEKKFVKK